MSHGEVGFLLVLDVKAAHVVLADAHVAVGHGREISLKLLNLAR